MVSAERTPVLIVGGGLVGLSAALFLQYHGVGFVLVERRDRASVLPRSRGVHTRTVEMFRQVGLEDRVQQAGPPRRPACAQRLGHRCPCRRRLPARAGLPGW
jgi:2-polyprenyl-6-methoxyphenol hydroxylase-like FAD-dependent oxidoreductase